MPDERIDPPYDLDERAMLESWLDYHRATLLLKCDGLDSEQLKLRSVPPSSMSLLGLVRHMAEVERWWFRVVMDRQPLGEIFCTPEEPDRDFDGVDDADAGADRATFLAEVEAARAAAAGHGLDDLGHHDKRGDVITLRWVLVHMVEEYARHNGHADLLRETIDGVTGD